MSMLFRRASVQAPESRALGDLGFSAASFAQGAATTSSNDPTALYSVFAAHRRIIDAMVVTPLKAYQTQPDGTSKLIPLPPVLRGNDGTTSSFVAAIMANMLYDGNAVGLTTSTNSRGEPQAVVWLPCSRVSIYGDGVGPTKYLYDGKELPPAKVTHIPWITPPGRARALSPLGHFKAVYDLGRSATNAANNWYANGAAPSGHLKNTSLEITDQEKADTLRARFRQAVQGRGLLVTGKDWEYTPIGVPADQAQFVESTRMTATQVAAIYGVPAGEIGGDVGSSLTYSTLEQQQQNFVTATLQGWAVRLEHHLNLLLPPGQYVKFNLDAHIRADLLARMSAHKTAIEAGILTINEVRELEDRPPLPVRNGA